jgi:hypothetical protein
MHFFRGSLIAQAISTNEDTTFSTTYQILNSWLRLAVLINFKSQDDTSSLMLFAPFQINYRTF